MARVSRANAGDDSNPHSGEGGPRRTAAQLASDPAFTGAFASPQGAWSAGTYGINAVATYQGSTYRSLVSGNTATPGTDPAKWETWGGGGSSAADNLFLAANYR